jgi:hypothetical protein
VYTHTYIHNFNVNFQQIIAAAEAFGCQFVALCMLNRKFFGIDHDENVTMMMMMVLMLKILNNQIIISIVVVLEHIYMHTNFNYNE